MFLCLKKAGTAGWRWFRQRSMFVQLLMVVPILLAAGLPLLVGNMGLAVLGTAYAINAAAAGLFGGFIIVLSGKGGISLFKDRNKR